MGLVMNYKKYLLKNYIINASDINYLIKTRTFKKIENKLLIKKINIKNKKIHKNISNNEHLIFLIDQYIYFVKQYIHLDPLEIRYLIESSINNKNNNIFLCCDYFLDNKEYYIKNFKNLFLYNYCKNYKKMKIYLNNIIKITSFEELCALINKNKEIYYILFDNINKQNIDKYSKIWQQIII